MIDRVCKFLLSHSQLAKIEQRRRVVRFGGQSAQIRLLCFVILSLARQKSSQNALGLIVSFVVSHHLREERYCLIVILGGDRILCLLKKTLVGRGSFMDIRGRNRCAFRRTTWRLPIDHNVLLKSVGGMK